MHLESTHWYIDTLASPGFFNCKLKLSGLNYNRSQCTVHTHQCRREQERIYKLYNCTLCYNSI